MGFGKPFRAPPVRLGPHYRGEARRAYRLFAAKALAAAVAAGLLAGAVSVPQVRQSLAAAPAAFAPARARLPQPGDHWGGCDAARAAGTAPIYAGEPGYREDMDGDLDGIACEPHRYR